MSDPSTEDQNKDAAADGAETQADDAQIVEETVEAAEADPEPEVSSEPDHHDADDHHHEEHQGSTFAGTALKLLLLILVGFGLAVWLLPRALPMLPDTWAAKLMPAQMATADKFEAADERFATIEAKLAENPAASEIAALEAKIADLQTRLEAAEQEAIQARTAAEEAASVAERATVSEGVVEEAGTAAERAATAADTATTAATEAGRVASSAVRDTASLARRMTGLEAQLAAVSEELATLGQNLAATPATGDGEPSAAAAAAYAALKARIEELATQLNTADYLTGEDAIGFATQDDVRAARTALTANLEAALSRIPNGEDIATKAELEAAIAALDGQLTGLSGDVASAAELAGAAEAAATAARDTVGDAITAAELQGAIAAMMSRLEHGQSFAAALGKVAELSGVEVPEALSAVAATGTATPRELLRDFGRPYQAAIAADIREQSDGGVFGNATARLRSIASGRPKDAQEGEGAEAVLSRVEAALKDGDIDAALAEADTLSEPVQEAMGGWLTALRARAAAMSAATEYVAGLGSNQG